MTLSKIQAKLRSQVLNTIYANAPISRVDIAKQTGITPATTSSITGDLIQEGFIYELGEADANKVGRKKILLDIAPNHLYYVGVEISEKRFTFVITDNLGNIQEKEAHPLHRTDIKTHGVTSLLDPLNTFLQTYQDSYPIQAIGIAIPGRYLGNYQITTNNQLWKDFHLQEIVDTLDYPVFFSNNVNSMALAKRFFNTQRHDENFIYFHCGRGMHCSYIYEGRIYGKDKLSIGEIGHTVVTPQGELCECGRYGCLQTYASESWLIKKAKILYQTSPHTYLKTLVTDEKEIKIKTLLTAYDLGDTAILHLLNTAVHFLAQAILNLNMIIDANKIYLHSYLFTNPHLVELLSQEILYEPQILLSSPPQVHIEPYTEFTGAIAGAALCLYQQYLRQGLE